ncbi:AAA family ATPase [Salinicoccus albus]|uniref:AAA family ATPase n=1 Tax=Salinicoccus albus TaxID=418756 RepID=UPI000382932C|nr:AAA family ATPase [Salinicoccus albus]
MQRTRSKLEVTHDFEPEIQNALYNAAKSIINRSENDSVESILFTSNNDPAGVCAAASHIAHLLTQLNRRVLIINLDLNASGALGAYFEDDERSRLIDTISHSSYLSEAIQPSQYEDLDYIEIETVEKETYIGLLNKKDIKTKLVPLKNYYDYVLLIGPESDEFEHYANIFELADAAVTISKDKTSDYRKIKSHMDKFSLFNVKSFGIIRNVK